MDDAPPCTLGKPKSPVSCAQHLPGERQPCTTHRRRRLQLVQPPLRHQEAEQGGSVDALWQAPAHQLEAVGV